MNEDTRARKQARLGRLRVEVAALELELLRMPLRFYNGAMPETAALDGRPAPGASVLHQRLRIIFLYSRALTRGRKPLPPNAV
jgi:hypothetical protein